MAGNTVFGIYPTHRKIENALTSLKFAGFRPAGVSFFFAQTDETANALFGGAPGWLAGIGALAIPGVGSFIAAGPIMALLGGGGPSARNGGLAGALAGAGMTEYEATRYEDRIQSGGILLSLQCDNAEWAKLARTILRETGAEDISSAGESDSEAKPRVRHAR